MAVRTYGKIHYDHEKKQWIITEAEPHIRIKLKAIFLNIGKTAVPPFSFNDTTERSADLLWFTKRYPLSISDADQQRLNRQNKLNTEKINQLETIMLPSYKPGSVKLKKGFKARKYQLKANEIFDVVGRLLLADEYGLGKSLTSILAMMKPGRLPAVVVCQTHLPFQWKAEVEKYTDLKVHIIKGTRPYDLPKADVYILKYSCLYGWCDLFYKNFFRYAVFDECQELRTGVSDKCHGARMLSNSVEYCMGLSATPIYNYGGEIFNVLRAIKPECLGTSEQFYREWTDQSSKPKVLDPAALGTYLRENMLMLRRTRDEVGMELPVINTIVQYVDADEKAVEDETKLAEQLALKVLHGSFEESGMAAREFDMRLRHMTGISKAKQVAIHVKMLLDAGEPVLLAAWHRDVYEIWEKEFAEYDPVMYTGSETGAQKDRAATRFKNGDTDLMIISLRSGAGLEGLQDRARYVAVAELDYSPQVHGQLIARLHRPGQRHQVTTIYYVAEFGCDPAMIDILGLKSSQSHGIVDPLKAAGEQFTDTSKIKEIARKWLETQKPASLLHEAGEMEQSQIGVLGY